MGITAVSLGKSFTNEIIMPILSPLLGTDNWKNTRLKIWKFDLGIGLFISELIYFVIITLIMFFVVKILFKKTIDKVIERKHRWNKGLRKSQGDILNVLNSILNIENEQIVTHQGISPHVWVENISITGEA